VLFGKFLGNPDEDSGFEPGGVGEHLSKVVVVGFWLRARRRR
jgi:hypothetical protein